MSLTVAFILPLFCAWRIVFQAQVRGACSVVDGCLIHYIIAIVVDKYILLLVFL